MSTSAWWTLREKFQQRIPATVDGTYLAAVLGYKDAVSALQITRPLRRMGLIDDNDKPTPLATRWRDDGEYPKACEEIRQARYPEGLLDAFSDKEADREAVQRWFSLNTGAAASSAKAMAGLYLLLLRADPKEQHERLEPKVAKPTASPKASGATVSRVRQYRAKAQPKDSTVGAATVEAEQDTTGAAHGETPRRAARPHVTRRVESALNINIQIHIPADAEATQIDQIFASMAKHLGFGRDEDPE